MKRIYKRLTALLLVFAMMAAVAPAVGTVKAVDLNKSCSLTIDPGEEKFDDLDEANIVADLYLIADASPLDGYDDSYTYSPLPAYTGLDFTGEAYGGDWAKMAEKAAEIALNSEEPVATVPLNQKYEELSSGLYLVITRGEDVANYMKYIKNDKGERVLVSIAQTISNTYSFSPILVSLPNQEGDNWVYDHGVSLKPAQASRFGDLEIVKYLHGYVTGNPATFVFEIEAVEDGAVVYSDVVSLTFTADGEQSVTVEGIPVGSEVTVTEVYSGAGYRLISDGTSMGVIEAGQNLSVSFTGEATDSLLRGGGVTHHFTYVESEFTGEDGKPVCKWTWTPIPHDS